MGEVERCSPTRVLFTQDELATLDKEQLLQHWLKQENYINWMESQLSSAQIALTPVRELEEKLRHSISSECARRESVLLMRLNSKEQEIQDLIVQIQELKSSQAGSPALLRSTLLDPAVNVLIQHLRKDLEKAKAALEESQNELSAWKFTPDSNTGKRLMAKCRLLYQENEELGRMISSGRLAKLEGDLALQRNFSEEMKKSQSELDEFLLELDEDVEGMQSTIYFLQQQLRQTRDQLVAVQKENEILRNSGTNNINQSETHLPENLHQPGGQFDQNDEMCSSHLIDIVSENCNGPTQTSNKRNLEKILEISGNRLPSVLDPERGSSSYNICNDHSATYLTSEKKRTIEKDHIIDKNVEIDASTGAPSLNRPINKTCEERKSQSPLDTTKTDRVSSDFVGKGGEYDDIETSLTLSNLNQNRKNSSADMNDHSQQCAIVEALVNVDDCRDSEKLIGNNGERKESKYLNNFPNENEKSDVGRNHLQNKVESMDIAHEEEPRTLFVESGKNDSDNIEIQCTTAEDGDKCLLFLELDSVKNMNSRKSVPSKSEVNTTSHSSIIYKASNQEVNDSKNNSEATFCSKTETASLSKRPRVDAPEETFPTDNKEKEN